MLDHLVPAPEGIPFPQGGEAALVRAPGGMALRCAFFRPPGPARGTIVLLQGRAEFIEKYGEVYIELLARGFAVATLDWRSQGGSARIMKDPRKGHVEDFSDYAADLEGLLGEMERRAMPRPYGLIAHSTGAAVALQRLAQGASPFERALLCAPLVEIGALRWKAGARGLARLLSLLGLAGFYVPFGGGRATHERPFEGNPVTSDRRRYGWPTAWYAAEPRLAVGDPTIGWVEAAFECLEDFENPQFGQKNRTPLLMLLGSEDTVTNPAAAATLASRMRGASSLMLHGARHEILFEGDAHRAAFWAAFDAFMLPDTAG